MESTTWFVIDRIIDSFFFIDIILNFITAYNDKKGTVWNLKRTMKHYIFTWFLIDLISTIPFDLFVSILYYYLLF